MVKGSFFKKKKKKKKKGKSKLTKSYAIITTLQHNLFLLPNSAKKREALLIGDGSFPNWKPRRRGSPGFQTHLGQVLGPQAPGTANTSSFTPRALPSLFSRAFLGTKTFSEKTYTNMESYTIFEILMGGGKNSPVLEN